MSEYLRNQGRLAQDKEKAAKLELRIEGFRDSIRGNLDPFEPVENLKLDLVAEEAFEIRALQIELIEVNAEIKAINKALGRN